MAYIVIGGLSFVLFGLYDINCVLWKNKFLHFFFLFGVMGIFISTTSAIWSFRSLIFTNFEQQFGWFMLALLFMSLLIHALFFALPFEKTYVKDVPQKVHAEGVYALCRHPGVLWFFGLYVSLYLWIEQPLILVMAITFSLFNFVYIIFQDLWTFPNLFIDYDDYKRKVPFLIPTPMSIKQCISHKTGGSYGFKK